jgi:hypothetical protein
MTQFDEKGCLAHCRHIWEQTCLIDPEQPYRRKSAEIAPVAIVFSQDDIDPDLGPGYLRGCSNRREGMRVLQCRDRKIDDLYSKLKGALISGNFALAERVCSSHRYQCVAICTSGIGIFEFFRKLHSIGAEPGCLSDSDFFQFKDSFAVTWTPDYSSLLEIFP